MNDLEILAMNTRKIRSEMGENQEDFAAHCGISP